MKSLIGFLLASLILLSINSVYGATIKGKTTDATSGDPLVGAHVSIVGTSLGATSDIEGGYSIQNLPMGTYSVKFSYIGYNEVKHTVTITKSDTTVILDVKMQIGSIVGQEVVVSASASGQLSAINQQLSSDAVVNIVDAARIRQLPDQNAAEAIARLPGITISRNNGEGSGVGIRGLSPQYNQVQIDGVVMGSAPDMGRAQDYSGGGNRSVSLSSVSQENLGGIEVYKAIMPDMDAATLGGTVNLRLGRAPSENVYEAKVFGAYNAYEEDWSNYKLSGKAASRLWDGHFGLQLSIDGERRNRGNDRLNADIQREDIFQADSSRISQYRTASATIRNLRVLREKWGFNAIFDYFTEGTEILFSNFYSSGTSTSREIQRQSESLYGMRTDSKTYSLTNALRGTHNISNLEIEWQLSRTHAETETPDDYQIWWAMRSPDKDANPVKYQNYLDQSAAFSGANRIAITPEELIQLFVDDGEFSFNQTNKDVGRVSETKYAEKLDFKYPFFIEGISGFFKTGVLLSQVDRSNDFKHQDLFNGRFPTAQGQPLYSSMPTDYNPDPVLNGNVSINHFFDVDKIQSVWTDVIKDWPFAAYDPLKTDNRNYDVKENYYAGYFMMKMIAFDGLLTFIPGIRYEGDSFDNTAYYWYIRNESTTIKDGVYEERNAKRTHGFWLPMVHLKIKPMDWFDVRLAITKTISRPSFSQLLPNVQAAFNDGYTTVSGNPDLKSLESWNFDLSGSVYDGKFGLLTVTGFYKEIKNFAYSLQYFIQTPEDAIRFGLDPQEPGFQDCLRKNLRVPVNIPEISTIKGFEIDFQANLLFLPGLLKNIVFSTNYTRLFSKSQLTKYSVETQFVTLPDPPYYRLDKTYDIGFRESRLPTTPDHILNVALGYDVGGFSGRVSAFYQGQSLVGVGLIEKADTYVDGYLRFDMSLRYRFSDNISLLVSGVNLTSRPDVSTLSGTDKHSSYDVYGTMYDFGVQVNF